MPPILNCNDHAFTGVFSEGRETLKQNLILIPFYPPKPMLVSAGSIIDTVIVAKFSERGSKGRIEPKILRQE